MRLTGIPLILLAGVAAMAALVVTVRRWSRGGRRRRLITRTLGALAAQALLVLTVGLIVNRDQAFYPSWQALAGAEPATAPGAPPPPHPATEPPGAEQRAWRLARPLDLITPPDYAARPGVTFPVIVVLCPAGQLAAVRAAARGTAEVVTAAVAPTRATTAAALRDLAARLPRYARVTDHGWVLIADRGHRRLADDLRGADGRFAAPAVTAEGPGWATVLTGAADELPAPLGTLPRP